MNYKYEDLMGPDGLIYEVKTLTFPNNVSDDVKILKFISNLESKKSTFWANFSKIICFERIDTMYKILDVLDVNILKNAEENDG